MEKVDKKEEKINVENDTTQRAKEQKNEIKPQPVKSHTNNKKSRTILIVILIIMIVLVITIILSTIFGFINRNNTNIILGTKIDNIDVSGLTKEEAINKLENELNNNEKNYIIVKQNNYSKKITLNDINGKFNINEAVEMAYNLARTDNLVVDNYKILKTLIIGNNINVGFSYDEDLLQKVIDEISIEIPNLATESSYIIDKNKLYIKSSKDGVQIKKDVFKQNVVNSFIGNKKEFEIEVEECKKKEINIEEIYKQVCKKPVNAYYTTNPNKIYKEENGLDFAISLEEAKKMLAEEKEEYVIELKVVKPQITVADLDSGAYPDVLATFTTKYGTADINRNINISLAAKSINSVVLMPGETFSYNDLIGDCSIKTGYKTATIYLNGELSTGIGGGICQVSTTLYNAVLRANLEIVERRNHSLGVTYVPSGQDAMVSIGSQDFKFKNNREYPIKVVAYVGKGSITCEIHGLKQETEYEVKLFSRTISKTDKKYKVETYKILYLNDKEVSRTWLSTDTYKYH